MSTLYRQFARGSSFLAYAGYAGYAQINEPGNSLESWGVISIDCHS